jgi:hypothetical protein
MFLGFEEFYVSPDGKEFSKLGVKVFPEGFTFGFNVNEDVVHNVII